MSHRYLSEMFTPDVRRAQERAHGRAAAVPPPERRDEREARDALGPDELDFIGRRDSFYLATVNADGWPYVQHRGGPRGFLRALDERTLAFADVKGNRQLITAGNLAGSDKVSMFLVDYPQRARLKLLGRARAVAAADDPALADRVAATPELRRRTERVVVIDVVAFDWNCSAYLTPRYTADEIEELIAARRPR